MKEPALRGQVLAGLDYYYLVSQMTPVKFLWNIS